MKTEAELRADYDAAELLVIAYQKPDDAAPVLHDAAEFKRCRPEWTPERCWAAAREKHATTPWRPR